MPTPSQLLHEAAFRRAWLRLLLLLTAVVAVAALTPGQAAPSLGIGDKVNHVLAFGALGLTAMLSQGAGRRAVLVAAAGLLLYGILIEVAQTQVPGREASWADLGADAVGIAGGLLMATGLRHRWPDRRP